MDATRDFRDEVLALQAALDALPLEKTVTVRFDTSGMPGAFAAAAAAGGTAVPAAGGAEDAAAQADALRTVTEAAYADAAAQEAAAAATQQGASAAADAAKNEYLLAMAERMRANTAREAAAAAAEARGAEFDQTAVTLASIDATISAAKAEILYADTMKVVNGEIEENAAATAKAAAAQAAAAKEAEAARVAALAGSGGGGGVFGFLGRDFPLFGGVLGTGVIGSVKGFHIALDAALEGVIALGSAITALSIGLASMAPAAKDIYTHLSAVQSVSEALGVNIPPLTGKFEALSKAMAPQTVEAYGGALDALNQSGSALSMVAHEVVRGIDDWIARLDLFMAHQSGMGKILQDGVGFLSQFRQAVDNVGLALHNLIVADPGTAHYLMDLVVAATRLLDVITAIPAPILTAGMALHSFWLWGGLAGTQAARLLGPLRAMALGMGDVAAAETAVAAAGKDASGLALLSATVKDIGTGFASYGKGIRTAVTEAEGFGKAGAGLSAVLGGVSLATAGAVAGAAALAAGVGYLTYQMLQSSQASQKFAATVNQAFTSSSATQFLTQYPQLAAQGMAGLSTALHTGARAWVPYNVAVSQTEQSLEKFIGFGSKGVADSIGALGDAFKSGGKAIGDFFASAVHAQQAANSVRNYTGALATLDKGQKNLLQDASALIRSGHSVAQSFALMDIAGVTAADTLPLALRKVQNLITGYQNMSVQGGILSGAVNAVTFAAEQQSSKISALTQAYSTWFSTITGGESAFNTFAQQTIGLYQALAGGSATLSDSNGKVSLSMQGVAAQAGSTAVSMTGLNTASLNAQQTFLQSAQAAQNQFNSLLTLASAASLGQKGTQMLTGAMRDYMAILMPTAGNNKALQQTLISMYQEINPNIKTWGQLGTAVGNVRHPLQDLQNTTTAFTVAAGNLTTDTQNLATAIGQNLNQAMAQAILQADGGQGVFDKFASALLNSHESAQGLHDAALHLAEKLLTVFGNTKTAEAEFIVLAGAMHLSRQKATDLWNSIVGGAAAADAAVRTHAANIATWITDIPSYKQIVFDYIAIGNAGPPPGPYAGGYLMPSGHAAGWKVPGHGHGDIVPAMLEPGEAVVPRHLVPAVAPFLAAHHVPGFASGGYLPAGRSGAAEAGGRAAAPTIEVHLHGDLARDGLWEHMQVQTLDYNYANTGRTTGKVMPGR